MIHLEKKSWFFFFCCNRRTMHFSVWSGKMEWLLPFSRCYQQFLPHYLKARIVRQLKIVHTSHYGGQEVVWVFCWFECLPDNCQGWVQTPEAWFKGRETKKLSKYTGCTELAQRTLSYSWEESSWNDRYIFFLLFPSENTPLFWLYSITAHRRYSFSPIKSTYSIHLFGARNLVLLYLP